MDIIDTSLKIFDKILGGKTLFHHKDQEFLSNIKFKTKLERYMNTTNRHFKILENHLKNDSKSLKMSILNTKLQKFGFEIKNIILESNIFLRGLSEILNFKKIPSNFLEVGSIETTMKYLHKKMRLANLVLATSPIDASARIVKRKSEFYVLLKLNVYQNSNVYKITQSTKYLAKEVDGKFKIFEYNQNDFFEKFDKTSLNKQYSLSNLLSKGASQIWVNHKPDCLTRQRDKNKPCRFKRTQLQRSVEIPCGKKFIIVNSIKEEKADLICENSTKTVNIHPDRNFLYDVHQNCKIEFGDTTYELKIEKTDCVTFELDIPFTLDFEKCENHIIQLSFGIIALCLSMIIFTIMIYIKIKNCFFKEKDSNETKSSEKN